MSELKIIFLEFSGIFPVKKNQKIRKKIEKKRKKLELWSGKFRCVWK